MNILITGGNGNLGQTVVPQLLQNGMNVHLAVREPAQDSQPNSRQYTVNLMDEAESGKWVHEVWNQSGQLSGGVFLAGGYTPGSLESTSMKDITKMIELNVGTFFHTAKALLSYFRQTKNGHLILIGAATAMDPGSSIQHVAYSLSKQALFNLSAMINADVTNGTTAHILLPSTLDTPLNRSQMPDADFSTWTQPADIARVIAAILKGTDDRTVIQF